MAATEQLFNVRERKRFERHDIWERIAENGTISAAVMVFAAIAAVICANTDAYEAIHHFLETPLYVGLGNLTAGLTVELFVNGFLMAIFFLLVGIELKYEMTVGELKNPRQAMLPMLAAVGGVVVPACIYLIFNHAGARNGWAIPMATDIAFALGVLSLLGNRVPNGVRVFFSTLAIADDLISTTLLATPRPIVIAPAMNNGMWKAPATQANMATLRERGVNVVGPGSGYLACGDVDTGRMSEPEDVVEAVCEVLNPVPQDLTGKRIVITAGPTHEPIDPVRFIGNRFFGQDGYRPGGGGRTSRCRRHARAGTDIARYSSRRKVRARADRRRDAAGGVKRLPDGRRCHLRCGRRRLHPRGPCQPQAQKGQRAPGSHRTSRDG